MALHHKSAVLHFHEVTKGPSDNKKLTRDFELQCGGFFSFQEMKRVLKKI